MHDRCKPGREHLSCGHNPGRNRQRSSVQQVWPIGRGSMPLTTACDSPISAHVTFSPCHPCAFSLSSLYNGGVNASDYYNMSANSSDINPNSGLPYGFFHYPLQGLPDGYPLLVSAALNKQRAQETLEYIRDGGFLNRDATDALTLKVGWTTVSGVT